MDVNKEIKKEMAIAGLKQYQVANMLGISESAFCKKLRKELTKDEQNKIIMLIRGETVEVQECCEEEPCERRNNTDDSTTGNTYFSRVITEKINEWCKVNNKKQYEFAELIGVQENLVCNYKNGKTKPSDKTLDKICEVLGCDRSVFYQEMQGKALADYTLDELLAEIKRRFEAS